MTQDTATQVQPQVEGYMGRMVCPHCREFAFKDPIRFAAHAAECKGVTEPQGDGADRPFDTHGATGPALVHVEKSGPAFRGQLEASIVAHALKTAGEVINALHRRCLLDVCRSWPRLLTIAGVTSHGVRRYPRQAWEWDEMKESVELALCYAEQPDSLKWQDADATLRGYAMTAAEAIDSRLPTLTVSVESLRLEEMATAYRAFAEGRDA